MSKLLLVILMTVVSTVALGGANSAGMGDLSEGLTSIITAAGQALSYILLASGIGFLFGALIKYISHRANPSQVRLSEPIFMLALGLALLALPFLQYVVGYNPGIF